MLDSRSVARSLARGDSDSEATWDGPVYAALRRRGARQWHGWHEAGALGTWLSAARTALDRAPDRLEIDFVTSMEPLEARHALRSQPSWTGRYGLEVEHAARRLRFAPSAIVAANLAWPRVVSAALRALGDPAPDAVTYRRFTADQYLVPLDGPGEIDEIGRAGRPVDEDFGDRNALAGLARLLGGWMVANTGTDGRLVYKYWPSRGIESEADNTVRQFMGSIALRRFARWSGDASAMDAAQRNLDRQIATYFQRMPEGHGVIAHGGSAKLGAAALAGIAILESAEPGRHESVLAALTAGIDLLWQHDGAFRTFHFPAERNDNQNFYPGEAALFWAALLARRPNPELRDRLVRTLDHYRDWHRAHRNPAFVPWHAQAHVAAWEATGIADRLPFVFEMIDWLLPMQQWDTAPADDMRGRFYDPRHRDWGPPHAASTGAYLEGIAAAHRLAVALGDGGRADRYSESLRRGFRNIRQLAFVDPVDLFYISRRRRVLGGVRTEVYDNTIRIDNVQHALMAALAVLYDP